MSSISQLNGQERLRATMPVTVLRANSVGANVATPGAARQPDAVTLSDQARSMAASHKAVADAPEVREDRVSAIKSAIASGTYSIDSRRLATKLATSLGL